MASRQLGKFKQWAGEKISSREKTISADNDEFKETEQDIELRKEGLFRLHMAAEDYHHTLSKKKESPAVQETEKLLPLDTFGIVMINHGEEFGDQSAFGSSLVKLGRAHCRVATLQESYAITFQDGFVNSCKGFLQDIRDYEYQKKKLESRRLSYDAAINKLEKLKANKKEKEKDKKEAEDELQRSRLRYEETSEDVRARMQAIQENEVQQLRELTNFLDIQLNFAKQYKEIMQEVKEGWCDEATLSNFERSRSRAGSQHVRRSTDDGSRFQSIRSKRSAVSISNQGSSTDEEGPRKPKSRRPSESKTASRPTSRASRKRADSTATAGAGTAEKEKGTMRMSVAGWASSAVSSVTGRGRKESSNFAALKDKAGDSDADDDGEGDESGGGTRPPSSRSTAKKSPILSSSPRVPPRRSKPPSPTAKIVRAVYDFSGTADELPFKTGEEIVVLNEVSEDWWLGQNASGRKGLFPTNYVESISASSHIFQSGVPHSGDESEDDVGKYLGQKPVGDHAEGASAYLNGFDSASVISSLADHDEEEHLMPPKAPDENVHLPARHDSPNGSYSGSSSSMNGHGSGSGSGGGGLGASLSRLRATSDIAVANGKRHPPPPPPPRKSTTSLLSATPPLVPDRRSPSHSSALLQPNGAAARSSPGKDVSPFDSLMDISTHCTTFRQHPGEPNGFCSNCFRMH